MELHLISKKQPLVRADLAPYILEWGERFVKGVVDITLDLLLVGGELHADEEAYLLEHGSQQRDLWGINLYIDRTGEDWLEFDSMINLRPSHGNRSRGVEDEVVQEKIRAIVKDLIR